MSFFYTKPYLDELSELRSLFECDFLHNKTLALSGATGMIGSYLIDSLLANPDFKGTIIAIVRDKAQASERFIHFKGDQRLLFVEARMDTTINIQQKIDYLVHAASLTSPHDYHDHPIDTMLLNIIGNKHMLDLAVRNKSRYMFVSSTEVYGQSEGNRIDETYSGYLDQLDPRSAYNEGKRASETLCVAYMAEHQLEVVIPRLSRVFGPTLKDSDGKALSQFIARGIQQQPIVLKSQGAQRFSYTYVADAASAILFLLHHGQSGHAYNVASEEDLSLRQIAEIVANICKTNVTFDLSIEKNMSYSKAAHALLSIEKIKDLGWKPHVSISSGLARTCAVRALLPRADR
jgi:nucleoside-diphosphate-sugar epimerase